MLKPHHTCSYCKLTHKSVEASGIWYCPNFLCPGPGGHLWRSQCKSYKEGLDERHSVDQDEWITRGLQVAENHSDPDIANAIRNQAMLKLDLVYKSEDGKVFDSEDDVFRWEEALKRAKLICDRSFVDNLPDSVAGHCDIDSVAACLYANLVFEEQVELSNRLIGEVIEEESNYG